MYRHRVDRGPCAGDWKRRGMRRPSHGSALTWFRTRQKEREKLNAISHLHSIWKIRRNKWSFLIIVECSKFFWKLSLFKPFKQKSFPISHEEIHNDERNCLDACRKHSDRKNICNPIPESRRIPSDKSIRSPIYMNEGTKLTRKLRLQKPNVHDEVSNITKPFYQKDHWIASIQKLLGAFNLCLLILTTLNSYTKPISNNNEYLPLEDDLTQIKNSSNPRSSRCFQVK
jgi:hypothetical protein